MSKTYVEKLNEILHQLLNKNEQFGITNTACYWKIGTSIFKTFDRLYQRIENIDELKDIEVVEAPNSRDRNKKYWFKMGEYNVTPIKKQKEDRYASCSAIHQYNSMINSFGLGCNDREYKHKKDICNNGKIILNPKIKSLLRSDNRIGWIIELIAKSLFTNVLDVRKMAYSILIELIFAYNFDSNQLSGKNAILNFEVPTGHHHNRNSRMYNLKDLNDRNSVIKDIAIQRTRATYKEITNGIQRVYSKFEDIIDEIHYKYLELLNPKNEENQKLIRIQIFNKENDEAIDRERRCLKLNIFKDRQRLNLINTMSDCYLDIIPIDNNEKISVVHFNEANACHLFSISSIRELCRSLDSDNESRREEVISYASNPNNGLIMDSKYHNSFDRGQWFFNLNGEMVIDPKNEDYLLNNVRLQRIKIKSEVFNDKMKKFLQM